MAAAPSLFLERALEKILNDKDTKKSQHAELKKVCLEALDDVKQKAQKESQGGKNGDAGTSIAAGGADAYFKPFELACQSKSPRIISTALDCLEKLIAPGHLTGNSLDPDSPRKLLVERMVSTVCESFSGPTTDEAVQLQIIKAILAMVVAPTCEVHDFVLLQVLRTMLRIYLGSKNQTNQTMAKATLTQMLSIIFQRMEQSADNGKKSLSVSVSKAALHLQHSTSVASMGSTRTSPSVATVDQRSWEGDTGVKGRASINVRHESEEPQPDRVVRQAAVEDAESNIEDPEAKSLEEPAGDGRLKSVPNSGGLDTPEPISTPLARKHTPRLSIASMNFDNVLEDGSVDTSDPSGKQQRLKFTDIAQKDAFLVFRSLCKFSMESVETTDAKSPELASIVLSLELLLGILKNAGPVLKTNEIFVRAIKQHLCVALSKNGVSQVPQVFEVSLNIFLILLDSFKYHLKMQIEVFFKEIFLSILQSASSSYQHKWLVMRSLTKICGDAQCIVDIYLNYDCDLSLANIFERLVRDISHIAQGQKAGALGNPTVMQEKSLQLKGIECFVSILRCMVEWSRELYVPPGGLHQTATTSDSRSRADSADFLVNPVTSSSSAASSQPFGGRSSAPSSGLAPGGNDPESHDLPEGVEDPEMIEVRKKKKDLMEQGLLQFVKSPRKGMKFLQQEGLVGEEPEDVAAFFHADDRIDMAAIGEYLGEGHKYCIDVMYAYVDQMDFSSMDFVPALRQFLSGFRLPGESQKIDRLMEKFAARYCENNASYQIFASADAAYVLAYSIIMLATDLHSTKIKRENKMTKEQYIRMNRGINDQKDLPKEYLEGIYDEIARQEITLRAAGNKGLRLPAASSEKARRQQFTAEMQDMEKTAKALMEDRSHMQTSFTSATHIEHIRPMFKMAWTPFLAALSLALRNADDMQMALLCLDGFRCAIRISSIFGMQLERNAFVQSLAKFTLLTNMGLSEMKPKHIETIKTLIAVAHSEGNYVQESWHEILNVVSQLELAQLIGTSVRQRYISSGAGDSTASGAGGGTGGIRDSTAAANELLEGARGKMDQKTLATIQESMGETSSQSVVVAVDRIFTNSSLLDGDAIVDFVQALCSVSVAELENRVAPRMFCLTKIVEISYYNMGRIRLEWSRIWAVLGEYFNKVGCNSNDDIAFFAIDSLRQLSIKFLEKGELANFRFQKDFLKPFEYVMKRTESLAIRDMIVSCMEQMVTRQLHNIKSGWVNIFTVFHKAASDTDRKLIEKAFFRMTRIFEDDFPATIDTFQDAIKCLSEFACNANFPDIGMEAVRLIALCGAQLAKRPELFGEPGEQEPESMTEQVWLKGWFPVLVELSYIVSRCNLDVRTRALTVMFTIMKNHGDMFAIHWWKDLFSVVFRVFDNTLNPETSKQGEDAHHHPAQDQAMRSEWMTTTCPHALMAIVNVFSQYFVKLTPVLLDELLAQFCWCCQQENKELAAAGLECLEHFVMVNGGRFDETTWDKIVACIREIFDTTLPRRLLTWLPPEFTRTHPQSPIHIPRRATSGTMSVPSLDSPQESDARASPLSMQVTPSKTEDPASSTVTVSKPHAPTVESSPGMPESSPPQLRKSSPVGDTASQGMVSQSSSKLAPSGQPHPVAMWQAAAARSVQHRKPVSPLADGLQSAADDSQRRVFATLTIRCQVQRALIRAIDRILFSAFPKENSDGSVQSERSAQPSPRTERVNPKSNNETLRILRMPHLRAHHLLCLVDLLMQSHEFSKMFNENDELRTRLWKAGFMDRLKPNMWSQEVASMTCSLRLLFIIYELGTFSDHWEEVELMLTSVWQQSITYFTTVSSPRQRLEWRSVLLLLFHHFLSMDDERFDRHLLCKQATILFEIVPMDLDAEVRFALGEVLKAMHTRTCSLLQAD